MMWTSHLFSLLNLYQLGNAWSFYRREILPKQFLFYLNVCDAKGVLFSFFLSDTLRVWAYPAPPERRFFVTFTLPSFLFSVYYFFPSVPLPPTVIITVAQGEKMKNWVLLFQAVFALLLFTSAQGLAFFNVDCFY